METDAACLADRISNNSSTEVQYYANNFDRLCRLCLSGERLVTIYSNVQGRNVYYMRHFVKIALDLLAIKINKHDALPKFLCERCERNLNIIANFKQKCDASLRILERVGNSMINGKPPGSGIVEADQKATRTPRRRTNVCSKKSKQDSEDVIKKLPQGIDVKKLNQREESFERTENECTPHATEVASEKTIELIVLKSGCFEYHEEEQVVECEKDDDDLPEKSNQNHNECDDDLIDEARYSDEESETINENGFRNQRTIGRQPRSKSERQFNKPAKEKIVCSVCGAMVNNIKSHMIIHSGRPHQCEQCPKSFTSRNKLQSHTNGVHLKKRDFKCEICGKAFLEKNNLKGHMRIHTGDRKYSCDLCPKTFLFAGTLRCHMLTHTQEKRHECQVCGKFFLLRTTLNKHLRVHSDEKPHNCSLCDKRFRTATHMVVHMRTHTGEKPLTCRICGMGFAHHKARSVHMKTKHPDELVALGLLDDKGHLKF